MMTDELPVYDHAASAVATEEATKLRRCVLGRHKRTQLVHVLLSPMTIPTLLQEQVSNIQLFCSALGRIDDVALANFTTIDVKYGGRI